MRHAGKTTASQLNIKSRNARASATSSRINQQSLVLACAVGALLLVAAVVRLPAQSITNEPIQTARTLTTPGNWQPTTHVVFGSDTAEVFAVADGREQRLGQTNWTVTSTDCEGRTAIELRVGTGANYVTCVDAATHAPILTRYRSSRDSFEVRFQGSAARGWVVWNGQPRREISESFATIPFVGVAAEHLLGAFPLADGYATEIELYAPYAPTGRNSLRVIGSERLSFRGTARDAWIVELANATRPGANVRRFWIDKENGRLLQRVNGSLQDNAVVQRTR